MAKTPNKKRMKGLGRVRFFAHIDAIRTQLEAGWPKKAVLDNLAAELDMSYQQFLRYVLEYIEKSSPKPKPKSAAGRHVGKVESSPHAVAATRGAKGEAEKPKTEQRQRGFVFDPTAVDRKDLI